MGNSHVTRPPPAETVTRGPIPARPPADAAGWVLAAVAASARRSDPAGAPPLTYASDPQPLDELGAYRGAGPLIQLLERWYRSRDYAEAMSLLTSPELFSCSAGFTIHDGRFQVGWIGPQVMLSLEPLTVGQDLLDGPASPLIASLAADFADIVSAGRPRLSRVRIMLGARPLSFVRVAVPYFSDPRRPGRATELITTQLTVGDETAQS